VIGRERCGNDPIRASAVCIHMTVHHGCSAGRSHGGGGDCGGGEGGGLSGGGPAGMDL